MTETKMQLVDWLDDLCVRFIINLPREELESVERICFQVEEAQWFYEDFIRPLDPDLPTLNLRNFCLLIFQHCPMLSAYSSQDHAQAFSEFLAYKTRVPVRGAILLNEQMDQVLLVKGWKKGANWSFPRGKINKDEPNLDCAIREVYEETGYDVNSAAGLVAKEGETKYIEMNLREQHMRLYVFRGIPMDTFFEPRTRKEISKIQWWKLSDLPTLKKKKQTPDGQTADLAVNANKFYMVAPFLPQLKKWISAQRKLDKVKQSSSSAAALTGTDEEPVVVTGTALPPPTSAGGDMSKLLEGLRQSARPAKPSDLPEVNVPAPDAEDVAAQLKNFLGVPTSSSAMSETVGSPAAPEVVNDPKANSLLALLQSAPAQQQHVSQTPSERLTEYPKLPMSPNYFHKPPQRLSHMPTPPMFPNQHQMVTSTSHQSQPPQPPKTRSIQLPHQPAQLVPRHPHPRVNKPPPRISKDQPARAPYQRTGDPQFAQYVQGTNKQPSIPPASKLPPPNLNAQSTALLNLFKADKSATSPDANGTASAFSHPSQQEPVSVPALSVDPMQISEVSQSSNEIGVRATGQEKPRQGSQTTNVLVPSQVQPSQQSDKTMDASGPKSKHHDTLLGLFRKDTAMAADSGKSISTTLQLPSTAVELSAFPSTPGHSRDPSRTKEPVLEQASPTAHLGAASWGRPSLSSNTQSPQPPVSATINGPLNIPQFDMVTQASKEAKRSMRKKDHTHPAQRSPIQILTRPSSSQGQPHTSIIQDGTPTANPGKGRTPKTQTLVTPVKKPPPTPDLKGHEAIPKPFQPQILRRPAHADDSNEPSPIQPLPSPKLNALISRQSDQPPDHKKSLLSLFTKPSPAMSPASAAVTSNIDPLALISPMTAPTAQERVVPSATVPSTIDSSALISPMTGPTPQEQADAAFARLSKEVGRISQDAKSIPKPSQLPTLRTGSLSTGKAEGPKAGRDGGKYTPTSKTTPGDKAFLLGFLNSVAQGGR